MNVATLFVVIAASAALAQAKPDFSGTWVSVTGPDASKPGAELHIKQTATSITIGHPEGAHGPEHLPTYRLDGAEHRQPSLAHPSETDVTKASWDGNRLVIVVRPDGGGAQHKRVLSLQPDGMTMKKKQAPAGQFPTGFLDRTLRMGGAEHRYQVYVPSGYTPDSRWPVILFLHGAGERGADGLIQTEVGLGTAIRRFSARYPAIVVFPQVPLNMTWAGEPGQVAMAALEKTLQEFSTDRDRVYLTGISMGGQGSWALAYAHADQFAAVVVVCAFIDGGDRFPPFLPAGVTDRPAALAERIRRLPIWVFHGDADTVVPVSNARTIVASLRASGADVQYTELPGVGHNSWDAAYRSPEVAAWLFKQRRKS